MRNPGRNIAWLGETTCSNVELSGGKAANLSLLAEHYPVPPGFCVTTKAFAQAKSEGPDPERLFLSKELFDEIASAYRQLDKRCQSKPLRVAVRSSAAAEDGPRASFAGQHDTYLNVIGIEALGAAIVNCWSSAFTGQAIAYRRVRGDEVDRVHIGVLVQELIPADMSFILFSANPLNSNPSEMMINASWGLGESVVSGQVTPDVYVVDKLTGNTIHATVSVKQQMTVQGDQGTLSVQVPRLLQQRACLTADQVSQVIELGKALERHMGWPVDVEGAFHQDQLYLLQCRPITTLSQKEKPL